MSTQAIHAPNYRRELGNGLRLRWSAAADAEGLAELYAEAFRHQADSPPDDVAYNRAFSRRRIVVEHSSGTQ